MSTQLTPFDILVNAIMSEVNHAQMNDHKLPPDLHNPKGEPSVKIINIEAAIEGARRQIAKLPKTTSLNLKNCVFIGKNEDGTYPLTVETSDDYPEIKTAHLTLHDWILLGPTGASHTREKIKEDVEEIIKQTSNSSTYSSYPIPYVKR